MGESEKRKSPKVLAFFSCYNHGKYVAEAIESVLNQTYDNMELFIVNDGSTDNSAQVIENYAKRDKRITFVNLPVNTAAAGAHRLIDEFIRKCDADYVAGLASDDKWKLDKIQKQIDFMENDASYGACFTWDELVIEEGAVSPLAADYSHLPARDRFKTLRHLFMSGNFYNGASVVIRKDAYVENGSFNWAYRNLQDYDYWIRFHLRYPVYLMNEKLTYYRRHETNLSSTPTTYMRDRNELFSILSKNLMEMDDELFKKIFFEDFVYYDSCSHKEILAEKIVMLMRKGEQVKKQIAFCLYMNNGFDDELMDLLKNKYRLDMCLFHELTAVYGMEYLLIENTPAVSYEYTELYALLDFVDDREKTDAKLHSLKFGALITLMYTNWELKKNLDNFFAIRNLVMGWQDQLISTKKRMLVVAGEFAEQSPDIVSRLGSVLSIVVLPRKDQMFIDGLFTEPEIETEAERVYLYDGKEHRILPLWELQEDDVDEIIFYGCCNEAYPIMDVIENVSLATKLFHCSALNDNMAVENLLHLLREI